MTRAKTKDRPDSLDKIIKEVRHANEMYAWIDELITNKGDLKC